jgi:uncharacterized protein (TIGR00106 family)
MSVLAQFSIFPVDKGEGVGEYVSKAVKVIRDSGLPYSVGPMGTCMEGEWEDVIGVISDCFEMMKNDSDRIYMTISADYRKNGFDRIEGKVESVMKRINGEHK